MISPTNPFFEVVLSAMYSLIFDSLTPNHKAK